MTTPKTLGTKPIAIALSVIALAMASRIEIPMVPVPVTLQTYAVLMIAVLLGPLNASLTIVAYLTCAALSLPILSGGNSGIDALIGPTGGYLLGFFVAALIVGVSGKGWQSMEVSRLVSIQVMGHFVILLLGISWLALSIGLRSAFAKGFLPFVPGVFIKSGLVVGSLMILRIRYGLAPRSFD